MDIWHTTRRYRVTGAVSSPNDFSLIIFNLLVSLQLALAGPNYLRYAEELAEDGKSVSDLKANRRQDSFVIIAGAFAGRLLIESARGCLLSLESSATVLMGHNILCRRRVRN